MDNLRQNKSHAVMAQRSETKASLDNFPTPPWATRALFEHVLFMHELHNQTCLEPACGAGHMSKVHKDYFSEVVSSDCHPYGYGAVRDFIIRSYQENSFDWVITNPPFKLAELFALEALRVSNVGVAMLVRTVFIESIGRFNRLFNVCPPTIMAQFSERVPMVKGRLDKNATTATGYAWLIWEHGKNSETVLRWIEPCRKKLEKDLDYEEALSSMTANRPNH